MDQFKEENNLKNNTALAERLGVSKGYVSQVMNGNFNFSISKLVDLALTLGVAPDLELKSLESFVIQEEVRLERLSNPGSLVLTSLNTGKATILNVDIEDDPTRIAG